MQFQRHEGLYVVHTLQRADGEDTVMKELTNECRKNEYHDVLDKMKQELRQEVLHEIKSVGIRQKLFSEYYDLANATGNLLFMLENENFAGRLDANTRREYDQLMSRMSKNGVRCQILVEESTAEDYGLYLQQTEAASDRLH